MGFSMKGPNMSISYGGESNKQQKSNLMKDNPVAKHASAMNMGKAHSKSPNYKYSDTPMELTAEGKKKILASDANPEFKKAIAKSSVKPGSPATKPGEPKRVKIESEGMDGQGSTEYIRGGRKGDKNARSVTIEKDYAGKDQKVVRRKKKDGSVKTKSKKISSKKAERIKKRKDKSHSSESPVKNITCGGKKYKK